MIGRREGAFCNAKTSPKGGLQDMGSDYSAAGARKVIMVAPVMASAASR